jgi:hypothetical protein
MFYNTVVLAGGIKTAADAQSRILAKDQHPDDPSVLVYGPAHRIFKGGVDHSAGHYVPLRSSLKKRHRSCREAGSLAQLRTLRVI